MGHWLAVAQVLQREAFRRAAFQQAQRDEGDLRLVAAYYKAGLLQQRLGILPEYLVSPEGSCPRQHRGCGFAEA